ncbi:hypothetical protein SDC9_101040 [bioreactor metagenome]|uniref:Phosphoglycolate phosphatase n=1 Tax=bioreactor metagenome TaxID=1076179 RepID=A0A645AXJ7_9ZZZZ|nr:YqeG family HAD IIIA-type phosphatase [Erysipelotrichaceae bacterium]
MLQYFIPDLYIENYQKLNIAYLKNKQIKVLVCDIDNTLVPFDIETPTKEVQAFFDEIKTNGIIPVLISNNKAERVSLFANALNLHYYPYAQKPLKKTYRKLLGDYQVLPQEVACMGDQLMTDVFGAKRCQLFTILTRPLVTRDIHYTKINRQLEKIVFFFLKLCKKFDRGKYSEQM